MAIWSETAWYFSNEAEQKEGPLNTEQDAQRAEKLYGRTLDDSAPLTVVETLELRNLYEEWDRSH